VVGTKEADKVREKIAVLTRVQRRDLTEQMARLLAMVEAEKIEATPNERAYLKGVLAGLRA
jgi:hypothetical protein